MDKKIADTQIVVGDTLATVQSDITALKKGKHVVDGTYAPDPNSSATPVSTSEQFYGMPPNSFIGQTPLSSSINTTPVGPVPATGQTSQMTGQTSAMV